MGTLIPAGQVAVFTVKPGTAQLILLLPEVRVQVPKQKEAAGLSQFRLIYKIANRKNPELPATVRARSVSIIQLVPN